MKVIIAEKPSVARDIASIVGATVRKDGFMEGNGYTVTWAFGHLIALAMPEEYGITGYQRENLPILPDEFKLIPRQVKNGKEYKPDPGVMKQLKIIKELFNKSERIVVATDAGREGELIFRYVYQYLGCTKPFDRLWISSLTDLAIRKGMDNLMPGTSYDNLYRSAKARSQADWLVGINASQALSIMAGHGVWSLGRVQTPTLAMICSRYIENKDFKPEAYFQVKLHTAKDNTVFSAISDERYSTKNDAEAIFERVRSTESISVVKVEQKQVSQESPLLYDLTTLQKEANSRHSLSADRTLSIAQSLYEAKLISYPRTGSRYISEDVFAEVPAQIDRLSNHATFGSYARELSGRNLNRRTVNDKKVTDHHALLITENIPADISKDQRIIYDMIVARMLESFSGKCTKENTTVSLNADGVPFSVKGSVIVIPGWRAVMNAPEESEEDDTSVLPVLHQGDVLTNNGVEILEKQTKPRPLHTEASLLSAMETCGKELTNESEREALKESGIGTPATRASIIETLFSREYITREKKSLVPTNKGMVVYLAIKDKKIADVAMTGAWENALNKISNGDMDAAPFHKGIEVYAAQITTELLDSKINGGVSEKKSMSCPKCENGQVTIYRKVAKCNNEDCGFILFRNKSGKDLTDGQIEDLITKGKTGVIKGFKSKENKSFDAALSLDGNYKVTFVFNNKKSNAQASRKRN